MAEGEAPPLFKSVPLAEREGFEPSIPFGILAFQASALDHYATSPPAGHNE